MFCSECGTKNQDGAKFCENCGAELEVEETASPKKENASKGVKKESKKKVAISNAQKGIIVFCVIVVVILFSTYSVLANKTSPVTIAKDYIEAIDNKDYDKLYKLSEFSGDTTFISKENFKNVLEENFKETPFDNYTINKTPNYANNNLKAMVSVSFAGTSQGASDATIALTKEKGKKFLFFDSWKIEDTSYLLGYEVVKDFEIRVPKGSKVTYDGVELSDKYLVKDNDEKNAQSVDVYKLPQTFEKKDVKIEAVLPYGVTLSEKVDVSDYYSTCRFSIEEDDFSHEIKEKIKASLQAKILELETGLLNGKSFEDQKNVFSSVLNKKKLEEQYADAVKSIASASYTNSDFNITETNINSIIVDSDYTISFSLEMKYTCKKTDKVTGEAKDINENWYIAVSLNYEDDGFKIWDISNMYFAGYWW